ncbi:MAG: 2-C-methyl-D-erythritol 2,4-cyclodiphosphate synthase [Planctomycetaceae bacterium]
MIRVGYGHDTHRLELGRRLVIGGITIPHTLGPVAHSDGDVLLHAVTDALIGAAGWGDIGEWFPDTSDEFAGADSANLLTRVVDALAEKQWRIVNVDATVFAQLPKLSPFKDAIATRIAELLRVEREAVNVKAKTGEKVGTIGRQEALAAAAAVLIERD